MKQVDYKLFFAVLFLIVFGMIMISSVSVYPSFKLTQGMVDRGLIAESYNYFYVIRNISHVIISLLVLAVVSKMPFKTFEKYSKQLFIFIIFLLVYVLFSGLSLKGAAGWIDIPGLPSIQPTEFLKFTLVIYLASFLKKNNSKLHTFSDGFVPFGTILGIVLLLVGLQPDFGTIMVVAPVCVIMFFLAGANIKYLLSFIMLGIVLAFSVYSAGDYDKETGKNLNKLGYITQRIDNFMADNKEAIKNKTINYQTEQALIANGSGGFGGLGFGGSIQKYGYLPEVQGDFIFSVVVEELGFVGALVLLSIFIFIGYRGFYIYSHVPDLFAKFAAAGISSWILLQAFINIGVNLNIVPLTGITLPFISYGGSSLLSLALGVGLLLSISRSVDVNQASTRFNKRKLMF